MEKNQLKKGYEILKKIERLENEHISFRKNMGYNNNMPKTMHISGLNFYEQTKITDEILIAVIVKEVDNQFLNKISGLKAKFKNI